MGWRREQLSSSIIIERQKALGAAIDNLNKTFGSITAQEFRNSLRRLWGQPEIVGEAVILGPDAEFWKGDGFIDEIMGLSGGVIAVVPAPSPSESSVQPMSESSAKGGSSGEEFKSAESASSLDPIAEPQFQAKFDYIKKLEKYQTDDVEPLL